MIRQGNNAKEHPLDIQPVEENLWLLTVWHKDRMFSLKAARVGNELRILDSGQLFILKE